MIILLGASMLAICTDDQEAEISGNADDLRKIRITIITLLSSAEHAVSCPVALCDPAPYLRSLPELLIRRGEGPTLITATRTGLEIVGSDDSLARFASWFNLSADAQPGHHSHFEPLPGDPYHSPDSIPLVVAISEV